MKTLCTFCNREISPSSDGSTSAAVSYGICEDCKGNMFSMAGMELNKYLDSLPAPLILIDPENRVRTANEKARTMLNKNISEIVGFSRGVVLDCKFAQLPGGCGNTEHCAACTIRQVVMETFATGKGSYRIPASLNQEDGAIPLLISAERIADFVFMRIDKAV